MVGFLEDLPVLGRVIVWLLGLLGIAGADTLLATAVAVAVAAILLIVVAGGIGWIAGIAIVYAMVAVAPRVLQGLARLPVFRNVVNTIGIALPAVAAGYAPGGGLLAAIVAGLGAAFGVAGVQDQLARLVESAGEN